MAYSVVQTVQENKKANSPAPCSQGRTYDATEFAVLQPNILFFFEGRKWQGGHGQNNKQNALEMTELTYLS